MMSAIERHRHDKAAPVVWVGHRPDVWHYCPGGREHGGGIGRLVGYIQDAGKSNGRCHSIIDTRGPSWTWIASPMRLATAAVTIAFSRVAAPARIHHIHIAGRGSTIRKLILTAIARGLGARHVLHLHDYDYAADFDRRPPWLRKRVAAMFRGADRVVVLGRKDHDFVVREIGVGADRVVVMPNCVPDPGPKCRPEVNLDVGPPVSRSLRILFLGRLSERKGVPELLASLAHPAMADLHWRAVLAGDGPVASYRTQAAELGLGERVQMPGWQAEAAVRTLCATSDILVLPSHAEGLAMAVLEGLAHGLVVVTTRVGAHEEVLVDGVNGLFVPVGDINALTATLARLVRDPALCESLSRNGRATFEERFGIVGYLLRLESLYSELFNRRTKSAGIC